MLIREIRGPGGEVSYRRDRRVVRRVVSEDVARTVRGLLVGVVERGTAVDANLAAYDLGGKTGTPRRVVNGRYAPSQYNPNFVGLFPASAPQLVVVVRLMSPRGDYYGGRTAAPMTKTIVQAALAARDAALDRESLATRSRVTPVQSGRPAAATRSPVTRSPSTDMDSSGRTLLVRLDSSASSTAVPPRAPLPRPVPDVASLSLRTAVRALHAAGFRVQLAKSIAGDAVTEPRPGSVARYGSIVRLRHAP
jgi:membrane peptidoglycan carboxypeptidase